MPIQLIKEEITKAIRSSSQSEDIKRIRLSALENSRFPELPLSSRESWRKISLKDFSPEEFYFDSGFSTELKIDGAFVTNISDILNQSSYSEEVSQRERIIQILQKRIDGETKNPFSLLSLAITENGKYIETLGQESSFVKLTHTAKSGNSPAFFPQTTLVYVKKNTRLTLIEEFNLKSKSEFNNSGLSNLNMTPSFHSTVGNAVVEEGGILDYVAVFRLGKNDFHFRDFLCDLENSAEFHLSVVLSGGYKGKLFYGANLKGEGSLFRGIGIYTGKDNELNNIEMNARHTASHTESSIDYRTVLGENATSIFYGNLFMEPGIRDASSNQLNKNILLSQTARAESMPNLVVKAESVSANHGATVGELDEDALFFLMARGIPFETAKSLLVEGFLNQLIDEMPEAVRDETRELVKEIR